ncbi:hypothetical protein ACHAPX_005983 [Trichoderma viride]
MKATYSPQKAKMTEMAERTVVNSPLFATHSANSTPPKTESKPDQNKEAPSTETRDSGFKKTKLSEPQDNGDKDKQKPNFQIPPKSGTTQFASFLHDVAHAPAGGKPGIQWAPESTVLDVNLQRVAKEFRWVCYQFDYDLYINGLITRKVKVNERGQKEM